VAGATAGVLADGLGSLDPLDVGDEEELEDDAGSALAPSLPPQPLSSSASAAPHPIAVPVTLFNPRSFRRPALGEDDARGHHGRNVWPRDRPGRRSLLNCKRTREGEVVLVTVADVGSTLNDLSVDPDVIRQITAMLDTGSEELGSTPLQDIPGGAFGPAPAAVELAVNTAKAHAKVATAMVEMVEGLRGLSQSVEKFGQEALAADDTSAADLQALQSATSCVASPTVSDAGSGSCTLTGGGA